MALTVADIVARIRAEGVQQFVGELKKGSDATSSFSERAVGMGKKMMAVGGLMTAGVSVPLVALGMNAINAASDLNEAQTAAATTYGTASGAIMKASQSAATSVGLSQQEYLSAATTLGVFGSKAGLVGDDLANFGKSSLGAAADLASFYNAPVPEALAAIQSGLAGETEPLRRFGIFLNEATVQAKAMELGLVDASGAISEENKVLARQALIMEGLGPAAGDFAKTSDGLANKQRILKAELANVSAQFGQIMLPAVLAVTGGLSKLVGWVSGLSGPMKTVIVIVAGVVAALGPLLVIFGAVAAAIGSIAGLFGAGGALAGLTALLGPIALVVGALVLLGVAYKTNFLGFGDAVNYVAGKVADGFGVVLGFIKNVVSGFQDLREQGLNPIAAAFGGVARALALIGGENTPAWIATIARIFLSASNAVQKFGARLKAALSKITSGFNDIKKAFQAGGISAAIGEIFGDAGRKILSGIGDALAAVPKMIGEFLKGITTGFAPLDRIIGDVGQAFVMFGRIIQEIFQGDIKGAFDAAKGYFSNVWEAWSGTLSLIGTGILAAFDAIPWGTIGGLLLTGMTLAIKGLATLGEAAVEWLVSAFKAIDWGALIGGVISGAGDIASAIASKLGGFLSGLWQGIASIDWAALVPSLNWGMFVTVLDWAGKVASLAWSAFVSGVVNLAEFVSELDWGAWVSGAVDFAGMVTKLAWSAFVSGAVNLIGMVTALNWGAFVSGTVNFIGMVSKLAWTAFVSGTASLIGMVKALDWGAFVSGAVDFVGMVAALDWGTWVKGSVSFVGKVGSFAWSTFVDKLAWPVINWFGWGGFITKIDLSSLVDGWPGWGTYVKLVDLFSFIDGWPGWGTYVKMVDLFSFVDAWPGWGTYVPTIDWPDIPEFPGWESLVGALDPRSWGIMAGGGGGGGGTAGTVGQGGGGGRGDFAKMLEQRQANGGGTVPIQVPDYSAAIAQMNLLSVAVAAVGTAFSAMGAVVTNASLAVGSLIGSQFPQMATTITNTVRASQSVVSGAYPAMAAVASSAVQSLAQTVSGRFRDMSSQANSATQQMAGQVRGQFSQMSSQASAAASQMAGQVRSQFSSMGSQVNSAVSQMASQVRSQFSNMQSSASSSTSAIRSAVSSGFSAAASAASSGMSSLANAVRSGFQSAVSAAQSGVSGIRGAVSSIGSLYGQGAAIGSTLGQGIAAGIQGQIGNIAATASRAVTAALDSARAAAGNPRSPAPVFVKRVGDPIGEGIEFGIMGRVAGIARAAASAVIGAVASARKVARDNAGRVSGMIDELLAASPSSSSKINDVLDLYGRGGQPPATVAPVPANRLPGLPTGGGNTYLVIDAGQLREFIEAADMYRVITSPEEIAATWG